MPSACPHCAHLCVYHFHTCVCIKCTPARFRARGALHRAPRLPRAPWLPPPSTPCTAHRRPILAQPFCAFEIALFYPWQLALAASGVVCHAFCVPRVLCLFLSLRQTSRTHTPRGCYIPPWSEPRRCSLTRSVMFSALGSSLPPLLPAAPGMEARQVQHSGGADRRR